jgi:uncharacterized protein GlcG (DUF336 family)
LLRLEIAFGKALGALGKGFGGREFACRTGGRPSSSGAADRIARPGGSCSGGLPIRAASGLIGAVGVSGDLSENDEVCAVAATMALGLVANTGDT